MGLALDEPEEGDAVAEHGGVTFMMGQDIERFLPPDAQVAVDIEPYRGSFSVYIVGQASC